MTTERTKHGLERSEHPAAPAEAGVPSLAVDATLRFLRDGYTFGQRGYRDVGAFAFRTRLFGRPVLVAHGTEAVHVFGSESFPRKGALPRSIMHLLQDEGSVQSLDGSRHDERKALMLSLARDDRAALVALFRDEWALAVERMHGQRVSLLDLSYEVLARAALRWVGAESSATDRALAADLRVMVDHAATVGPVNWIARTRRRRVERWAEALIDRARRQRDRETAIGRLAHHREDDRELPPVVAAVELLNLLRPVVAVGRFIAFAGHALHGHPEWAARMQAEPQASTWFAEEVRRFYPIFPMIGGVAAEPFRLAGEQFDAGQWMLLDLYGTDHSAALWPHPSSFDPERFRDAPPHAVVAQGVGDFVTAHHCPGEQATRELIAAAVELLASGSYRVPEQDLRISLRRMPAQPQDGMLVEFA